MHIFNEMSAGSRHLKLSVFDDYRKAWNELLTEDIMRDARDHCRSKTIDEVMVFIVGKVAGKAVDICYHLDYWSTAHPPTLKK